MLRRVTVHFFDQKYHFFDRKITFFGVFFCARCKIMRLISERPRETHTTTSRKGIAKDLQGPFTSWAGDIRQLAR